MVRIAGGAIAVAVVGLVALAWLTPPLSLALTLTVPAVERWHARIATEPIVEEVSIDVEGRRLLADLYRPPAPRGAILLVHGLSSAGRRHPELVRLARVLARHGRLVSVPHFDGLAAYRLSGREVAEIRAGLRDLSRRHSPVGVAGFSFGAGPALLAAADVPDLALAASFGGYADLRHVLAYLTTGIHAFGARQYEHTPEEYNRWKLLALLIGFVSDERERQLLDRIATRRLANPGDDTSALEADLGAEGRAMFALVENREARDIDRLVAALPSRVRAAMEELSPLSAIARLRARLLIAHGMGDASIPFTESLRLAEASRGRADAVILETFEHTRPRALWSSVAGRARDAVRLVRLTTRLLSR